MEGVLSGIHTQICEMGVNQRLLLSVSHQIDLFALQFGSSAREWCETRIFFIRITPENHTGAGQGGCLHMMGFIDYRGWAEGKTIYIGWDAAGGSPIYRG